MLDYVGFQPIVCAQATSSCAAGQAAGEDLPSKRGRKKNQPKPNISIVASIGILNIIVISRLPAK